MVWASTSVKNGAYPSTKYIDALVGQNTIVTIPPTTLNEYRERGEPEITLPGSLDDARSVLNRLEALGIDMQKVYADLEREGVEKFETAYDRLMHTIDLRSRKLSGRKMSAVMTDSGTRRPDTYH